MCCSAAGVISGDDGKRIGGLCFVVRIAVEGDFSRGAVDGEGGCIVVVIRFQAVGNRGVVCCFGGIDDLVCTAVFINRSR